MEVFLGLAAIGILLYLVRFFEWKNFFKSLKLPAQIRSLSGSNAYEKAAFLAIKFLYASVSGAFQLLKFCIKCGWKMNLKIGGFKLK